MRLMPRLSKPVGLAFLALLVVSCVGGALPAERRHQRKELQAKLAQMEAPGLVVGEFALAPDGVIDGDTIRVQGLDSSMRLLGLDTEETFKKDSERQAFAKGWDVYKVEMRGDRSRPAKYPTPLGEEAKVYAKKFFSDVTTVRLERDHPKEIRDYFDRYLTYVFAKKNGVWVNFNVEVIRAGMSPYFSKYGYSRRFHDEFVKAQDEARAAKRGIWSDGGMHYDDYDERLAWWNPRGEFIRTFEQTAQGKADHIILTNWDAMQRLEANVGKEVVLLGAVSEVRLGDGRAPSRVMLSRRRGQDFALIFFDKDTLATSEIAKREGEYVYVKGFVSKYQNKRRKRAELQIMVDLPGQIVAGPQLVQTAKVTATPAPTPKAKTHQEGRTHASP
jgi:endonuclease YncB( thermonuclease family)